MMTRISLSWRANVTDNTNAGSGFLNSGKCWFWLGEEQLTEEEIENAQKIRSGTFGMPLNPEGMDKFTTSDELKSLGGGFSGVSGFEAMAAISNKPEAVFPVAGKWRIGGLIINLYVMVPARPNILPAPAKRMTIGVSLGSSKGRL
jgi:hypothetical protein